MKINVLSAYQTTAEEFFNKILGWKATLVLDIRLKNTNQLSGFTKQEDLEYFTHVIAHADYVHDVEYSPTKSLLDAYLDAGMPYEEYFKKYAAELKANNAIPISSRNMAATIPSPSWEQLPKSVIPTQKSC